MIEFKLSYVHSFAIDTLNNQLRLIVLNNGKELACRKTTPRAIVKFLKGPEDLAFKGRIQLLKSDGKIIVLLKNEPVGQLDMCHLNDIADNLMI